MVNLIDALGGRKTIIAVGCLVAGAAIDIVTERGLSTNLMSLMMAIVGLYSTANVLTKKVNGDSQDKLIEDVDVRTNYDSQINELSENQKMLEQYAAGLLTTVEKLQSQVDASNKRVAALLSIKDA